MRLEGRRPARGRGMPDPKMMIERIKAMDRDGNGKIERSEVSERVLRMFMRLDANGDGVANEKEIIAFQERMRSRANLNDKESRRDDAPAVGALAPQFTLKRMESDDTVDLASFKGKKPVVLVFGSYT